MLVRAISGSGGGGGEYVEVTNPSTSTTYTVDTGVFFLKNTTYSTYSSIAIESGTVKEQYDHPSTFMTLKFSYSSGILSFTGTSGAAFKLYGYYS